MSERRFGRIFFPKDKSHTIDAWLSVERHAILIEASFLAHNELEQWPIILGQFNGMDKVTFIRCYANGGIHSGGGGPFTKINVAYCITGIHISNADELVFKKTFFRSPALRDWLTYRNQIQATEKGKYQVPDIERVLKTRIQSMDIIISIGYLTKSTQSTLQFDTVCEVGVLSDSKVHINSFGEVWSHLKKLILFLTNRNPRFEKIYVYGDNDDRYELLNTEDDIEDTKFSQGLNLYHDLCKDELASATEKWFSLEKLTPVVDLLLEKQKDTEMWAQGFFLAILIAFEKFHSKHGRTPDINPSKLEKRIAIANAIGDLELRAWFENASSHWAKPSLREKIMNYKETIGLIKGKSFARLTVEQFIGKVVQTRNDTAHSGEHLTQFEHVELFIATKILEFTLRIEILRALGIDVEKGGFRSPRAEATRAIALLGALNNV